MLIQFASLYLALVLKMDKALALQQIEHNEDRSITEDDQTSTQYCISYVLDHSQVNASSNRTQVMKWNLSRDRNEEGCGIVEYTDGVFRVPKNGTFYLYSRLYLCSDIKFTQDNRPTMLGYQHCIVLLKGQKEQGLCDNGRMISGEYRNSYVIIPAMYLQQGWEIKVTMSRPAIISDSSVNKCRFYLKTE